LAVRGGLAMFAKVHHSGITVSDYRRSLDFYCGLLGMAVIFEFKIDRNPTAAAVFECPDHCLHVAMLGVPADLGGGMVELFHFERPAQEAPRAKYTAWQPGWTHICLTTDDIQGAYEKLKARGVRFASPPIEFAGEGVTVVTPPKVAGPGAGRSVITYCYDPDGLLIELAQFS
jgi:catechol 2,3-dioxygenase-like lactoylglutathione lyase family enzyme